MPIEILRKLYPMSILFPTMQITPKDFGVPSSEPLYHNRTAVYIEVQGWLGWRSPSICGFARLGWVSWMVGNSWLVGMV